MTPENNGQTLFVPMRVDALVVNESATGDAWNRWQMNYANLNSYVNPMPAPFSGQHWNPPAVGIHVRWQVPAGLTHGIQNEDGEIVYPLLPNRWVITRMQADPANPTTTVASQTWVVISDSFSTARTADGSQFVNPAYTPTADQPCEPGILGSAETLDAWDSGGGESGIDASTPFLTALGPADVLFASYVPGNHNVLSFYDDLSGINDGTFTYTVTGYFSTETIDPLNNLPADGWEPWVDPQTGEASATVKVAAGLEWAVDPGDNPLPTATAVHGTVFGTPWNRGQASPTPTDFPADVNAIASQVKVAIGNTSIDALSALVREAANADGENGLLEADLLEAFQYQELKELNQAGGQQQLDQKIRDAAFGSKDGGVVWTVVQVQNPDPSAARAPVELTSDQETWLAGLNADQASLDAERAILASMQMELYDLWWKSEAIQYTAPPINNQSGYQNAQLQLPGQVDPSNPDGFYAAVEAQQALVTQLAGNVPVAAGPDSAASIADFSKGHLDPSELELKPTKAPRYYHPSDPVVLVTGLGNSQKLDQDGDTLLCRNALVTGLTVEVSGTPQAVTATDFPAGAIPQTGSSNVPGVVDPLLVDAFFLDPNFAAIIANDALSSTSQTVIDDVTTAMQTPDDIIGTPPLPIAQRDWTQPWIPLMLDWQLKFFYTYKTRTLPNGDVQFVSQPTANDPNSFDFEFDLADWHFNGVGWEWKGGELNSQDGLSYSGRTFLTPQAEYGLVSRLKEFLKAHPDAPLDKVKSILENEDGLDILSQTLSGFNSFLTMIDPGQNVPPIGDIVSVVGANDSGVPTTANSDISYRLGGGSPYFFPVRGGFVQFGQLRILDAFGRSMDLLYANGNAGGDASAFYPVHGRGTRPDPQQVGDDSAKRLVKLQPSLVQPARLEFTWISSDNDDDPVLFNGETTPVCGWLLPNHLDRSLAVYDADGNALGELLTIYVSSTELEVAWSPAPGTAGSSPVVDPNATVNLPNTILNDIVTDLLNRDDNAAGFNNFLQCIDETLWTINPAGASQTDQNLAVLIGRPLAVMRTNLQLELDGNALYNQAWYKTFVSNSSQLLEDTGSLLDLEFPVRLGYQALRDDGMIGYYQGSDYSVFNAVHLPEDFQPAAAPATPYLSQIGANGNYISLKPKQTPSTDSGKTPFDSTDSVYATVLVDPQGVINSVTGILPDLVTTIPQEFVQKALNNMYVTFRAGPLLLDPEVVRIPSPAEQNGTWTWIQANGTAASDWQEDPVVNAFGNARLPATPLILREGWLKFTPNSENNEPTTDS